MPCVLVDADVLAPGRRLPAVRCQRCRRRFGLLTDHDMFERAEVPYHRVHPIYLKLRQAIQVFEDDAIRLLDGEVELNNTHFGGSFENRRARK